MTTNRGAYCAKRHNARPPCRIACPPRRIACPPRRNACPPRRICCLANFVKKYNALFPNPFSSWSNFESRNVFFFDAPLSDIILIITCA